MKFKVTNIEKSVKELFVLRSQIKDLKAKEAELQEIVDKYADKHISEFIDGQLALKNGILKIQQNPPKLVHQGSEKSLNVNERTDLADELSEEYIQTKPNLTKMVARLNGDKLLKQLLQAKGVLILQSNKYVAKPY